MATNGWLLRERERRLAISADVVTQLFNAYIGSRAKALEVIAKYNTLVDRYNRLDVEKKQLADQMAGLPAKAFDSELAYNQAREDRVTCSLSWTSACADDLGFGTALWPGAFSDTNDILGEEPNLGVTTADWTVAILVAPRYAPRPFPRVQACRPGP